MNNRIVERWNSVHIPERVASRAYHKREIATNGCWVSTYSVASHGYAQIGWKENGGRWMVLAHRASWVYVNGQIPQGMTLDHLCKNRRCVNPGHLRMLENFENARRTFGSDWALGTCKHGHPDSLQKFRKEKRKSGGYYWKRYCSECQKMWASTSAKRKKSAMLAGQ